ncbi:hypothetical protein Sjap_002909 [Stephania japonica]|uniref:Uncharacterized protein n=1 Tax=Stephania japonica TaxID=461633 RepID=A0AAP0KQ44_9MAGN
MMGNGRNKLSTLILSFSLTQVPYHSKEELFMFSLKLFRSNNAACNFESYEHHGLHCLSGIWDCHSQDFSLLITYIYDQGCILFVVK